jgi:hypothetical protein
VSVKYPEIKVKLIGENGNAFVLIGKVKNALLQAKVPRDEVLEFAKEAMAGDYDHVLQTIMAWVEVE